MLGASHKALICCDFYHATSSFPLDVAYGKKIKETKISKGSLMEIYGIGAYPEEVLKAIEKVGRARGMYVDKKTAEFREFPNVHESYILVFKQYKPIFVWFLSDERDVP